MLVGRWWVLRVFVVIKWFASLPRKIFVTLILGAVIVLVVLQDPPHTICRTQIENFKARQKGRLYKNPDVKTRKKPLMDVLMAECKTHSSPGSCYGLFAQVHKLINDFNVISQDCMQNLAAVSRVRKTLFQVYDLMVRLAWQEVPAHLVHSKFNWFSTADVALFCKLKNSAEELYGEQTLKQWNGRVFKTLLGTQAVSSEAYERSLISESCTSF